jgi:hypothetical protein
MSWHIVGLVIQMHVRAECSAWLLHVTHVANDAQAAFGSGVGTGYVQYTSHAFTSTAYALKELASVAASATESLWVRDLLCHTDTQTSLNAHVLTLAPVSASV